MGAEIKQFWDRPLTPQRAIGRIRLLWKENFVVILSHAQKRMRERQVDMVDIGHVIHLGRVIESSKPGECWRYTVEGRSVDGTQMQCVVEINGQLIIVTVIV